MTYVVTGALIVAAAGAVVSADASIKSGKAQQYELERQAEEEKISAESRELQRRQKLNKALAANAVSQSMSGIKAEGTPSSIALESAKQIAISEGAEALSDRLRQSQLQRQGKNARSAGNAAAASTLLSGAGSAMSIKASADT